MHNRKNILAFTESWFDVTEKNFLPDLKEYGNSKCTGRPPKLSATTLCRLFTEALKGQKSSRNLQTLLDLKDHKNAVPSEDQIHCTDEVESAYARTYIVF